MAQSRPSMRVIVGSIAVALLLAGSSSRLSAQPPSVTRIASEPDVQGARRLFSAWLEGQMVERGLPGVAVGVVADQDLVWAAGFGYADSAAKLPMTPQTKFRMASHSKLFTATAVMQLREQGKLRLDDPVSKYLPWFAVKPSESGDPPITIEELLTHSSGLPREAGDHWTTFEFPTTEQLRELLPAREAPFAPEVRWKYSNLAYSVAGMIVEAVSGQKWADYVHREIFQPLGMGASSVDKKVGGLAVGYGRRMPDGIRRLAPVRAAVVLSSSPARTMDSLLARATVFPAWTADHVGSSPAAPTAPETTISTSEAEEIARSPSAPTIISGERIPRSRQHRWKSSSLLLSVSVTTRG